MKSAIVLLSAVFAVSAFAADAPKVVAPAMARDAAAWTSAPAKPEVKLAKKKDHSKDKKATPAKSAASAPVAKEAPKVAPAASAAK